MQLSSPRVNRRIRKSPSSDMMCALTRTCQEKLSVFCRVDLSRIRNESKHQKLFCIGPSSQASSFSISSSRAIGPAGNTAGHQQEQRWCMLQNDAVRPRWRRSVGGGDCRDSVPKQFPRTLLRDELIPRALARSPWDFSRPEKAWC